jgi:hypothetical protein
LLPRLVDYYGDIISLVFGNLKKAHVVDWLLPNDQATEQRYATMIKSNVIELTGRDEHRDPLIVNDDKTTSGSSHIGKDWRLPIACFLL